MTRRTPKVVRLIVIWLALALVLGALHGCFIQNVNAGELLRDSVEQVNEGTRWGRFDIAYERVDAEYRAEFGEKHRRWGQDIEIADYELLGARLSKDEQSAISTVAVSWYSYETMTLHRTTIRQRWRNTGEGFFVLAEERVTGGDETLMVAPDADDEGEGETSGGERTARRGPSDEMDGESVRMGELAHQ
jgi:hypothetical protein